MAAINFPNSPIIGDVYPTSGAGPFWQWDGVSWLAYGHYWDTVLSDTVSATNYIGRAVANSLTSASVWTITKIVVASAGTVIVTHAYNVKWDDRLTETYS